MSRRVLLALCVGVLILVGVRFAFARSSHRITPNEAKRAFAQVGLGHPKVQTPPPGVILNYGSPPHLVSVSVYSGGTPKIIFGHLMGMRVTRWDNVMVYYNRSETPAVRRASEILGDHTWTTSTPR